MAFKDHTTVIICQPVAEGESILHVSHDVNGDWQFLCGSDHYADGEGREKALVSGINHHLAKDPTLAEVESLPIGWQAYREKIGKPWIKSALRQ